MSFRRHYGTGSYGSSLVSSPVASSYSSRGLGGYSSPYVTPPLSPGHASYGGYGSAYSSYGKSGARTRSASLPRDTRERSVSRHSSFSRGSSPPRSSRHHSHHDTSDVTTSSALHDLTNSALSRHNSFGSKATTVVLPVASARSYSRDYGNHYATAKALARAARSKSIGSSSSISSLSSGYGSRSGVSVAPRPRHPHSSPASYPAPIGGRPEAVKGPVFP